MVLEIDSSFQTLQALGKSPTSHFPRLGWAGLEVAGWGQLPGLRFGGFLSFSY